MFDDRYVSLEACRSILGLFFFDQFSLAVVFAPLFPSFQSRALYYPSRRDPNARNPGCIGLPTHMDPPWKL